MRRQMRSKKKAPAPLDDCACFWTVVSTRPRTEARSRYPRLWTPRQMASTCSASVFPKTEIFRKYLGGCDARQFSKTVPLLVKFTKFLVTLQAGRPVFDSRQRK